MCNAPEVGGVDIIAAMLEPIEYRVGRSGAEITIALRNAAEFCVPAFTGLDRILVLALYSGQPLPHVGLLFPGDPGVSEAVEAKKAA